MKHPLTQKRFSHRRSLVTARPTTAASRARQSTLTQLAFVSPPPEEHDSEDSYSDADFEDRPAKRVKLEKLSTSKRKDKTLTQIGFVAGPSNEDDDEVIRDSQCESEIAATPQKTVKSMMEPSAASPSPLPAARLRDVRILSTPITTRRVEAPSSNTPASIALSSIHKVRSAQSQSSSPLQEKSTNLISPQRRTLKRTATVQDSDCEDADLVAAYNEPDSVPIGTLFQSQAQYTYDPADAALDRDAARAAWTQALLRKSTIGDSMSDHEEDLVAGAQASSPPVLLEEDPGTPALRPSQISTVGPSQESPPPLVFTSATTERQQKGGAILVESSPLPVPPWSDSDAAAWEDMDKQRLNAQTLSDFSLPPPPGLFGSDPMFLTRTSS